MYVNMFVFVYMYVFPGLYKSEFATIINPTYLHYIYKGLSKTLQRSKQMLSYHKFSCLRSLFLDPNLRFR